MEDLFFSAFICCFMHFWGFGLWKRTKGGNNQASGKGTRPPRRGWKHLSLSGTMGIAVVAISVPLLSPSDPKDSIVSAALRPLTLGYEMMEFLGGGGGGGAHPTLPPGHQLVLNNCINRNQGVECKIVDRGFHMIV